MHIPQWRRKQLPIILSINNQTLVQPPPPPEVVLLGGGEIFCACRDANVVYMKSVIHQGVAMGVNTYGPHVCAPSEPQNPVELTNRPTSYTPSVWTKERLQTEARG
jgi:hypothetical protein